MPGPRGEPGVCKNCKKEKNYIPVYGLSRGLCKNCYKKLLWKFKPIKCKRCGRMKMHQAKGLCPGCYNSVFHIERVKELNAQRYHNISAEIYKKITKSCVICGFDKLVDLHHLDNNHKNNSEANLIGICPNHHKMLHHRKFRKELFKNLQEKGYQTPKIYEDDEVFKKL